MSKPKRKWYVVWKGALTGVFDTWDQCKALVDGYEGAQYKSFLSKAEADLAFKNGAPKWSATKSQKSGVAPSAAGAHTAAIIQDSISVDAACSGNPGVMEYRGVDTRTGKELFRQGPYAYATNNVGEFLAIIHGLAYLKQIGKPQLPIYSDSLTARAWVKNRKMKSELERNSRNKEVWELLDRAVQWMESNTWQTPILKWETKRWGEIPADFGRK